MRLATYTYKHTTSCGIVTDEGIIDIPSNTQGTKKLHSIKEVLIKDQRAFEILYELIDNQTERIAPDDVIAKAPIPRPGKILALAGNYIKHLEETAWQDPTFDNQSVTTNPWPFLIPSTAVTGNGATIPWPLYSKQVDYEIELAVFIGNPATAIEPDEAPSHIAGYSVANDISARSTTFAEGRSDRPRDAYFDWLMGKWANGFLPVGPILVTADEIPDPQNLNLEMSVNGQIRQQAHSSQMIFNVNKIISFMSHLMTLEPGDVIITGTPQGVAAGGAEYLKPGDEMKATIENIGTLTNVMEDYPEDYYTAFIQ